MTDWQAAMLCIVPVLFWRGLSGIEPKVRTWAALMLAGLATHALPAGPVPFLTYALIDALAALAVAAPRYLWPQRLIGLCFLAMFIADILAGPLGSDGAGTYHAVMVALGWLQWAILAGWGIYDMGGRAADCFGWGGRIPFVAVSEPSGGDGR